MPVPNASLTPDETVQWSPSGPTALALTTDGALRVQRPRGPLVQAGTVNLVLNPKGGSGAYSADGATTITTYTDENGYTVTRVVRAAAGYVVPISKAVSTIADGSVITVSFDVRGVRANGTAGLGEPYCTWGATTAPTASSGYVPSTNWKRVWFTITVGATAISTMYFSWDNLATTNGDWFEVRKPQVEYGASVGEYVDGDVADDTYWIDAANNSPSVRPDRFAEMPLGWFIEESTVNMLWPRDPLYLQSNYQTSQPLERTDMGDGTLRLVPLEGATALNTYFVNTYTLPATGPWITSYEVMTPGPAPCSVYLGLGLPTFPVQPGTWTPVSATDEITDISSPIRPHGLRSLDIPVGQPLFVRYPQFENKAYPSSYAEGGMGTGYSWQDAPFESPAIRAVATPYVTLPMPADQGSVYVRYLAGSTPISRYTGGFGQIGGAGSRALIPNISNSNQMNLRQGQSSYGHTTVADWDQPRGVYAEYNGNQVAVDYRDGVGKRYFERTGNPPPPTWTNDRIPIGWSGNNSSPSPLNGYVFAIVALPRPLTADEIAALDMIPTENLSYASIVGIGPQLGGLLLTHPDPGFAVLRTHGGS